MMAIRQHGAQTCVMIVEQDADFGITLADWLAAHGYQPVLVRSVDEAIEELREISPQVVFVGHGQSESATQNGISELPLLIQTLCPGVPVITIADQTSEDLTHVGFSREFTMCSSTRSSSHRSALCSDRNSTQRRFERFAWYRTKCTAPGD